METKLLNKKYILNPAVTSINETTVSLIENEIRSKKQAAQFVINLENVERCINRFFLMLASLRDYNISLVNVDSRILSTIYMMRFDKFVKIYGNDISLEENTNELINRRFALVR
ncbi:MAG: hypothetical protein NC200_00060 [Candidatus Gastranaerophilales bacterium]|nr:hypothetical protein [Candidatus Gastranaerophilales bacterium]